MRARRLIWITVTLLAASALAGVGAPTLLRASSNDPSPSTISVSGEGTVSTRPDTASTSFGVTTQGTDARQAIASNASATAKVIDALKRAGVVDEDIQTQYVSLDPRYDTDGSSIVGYTATNDVSATVRRIARVGDVIDAGVAAGANNIDGPTLSRDAKDKLYDQALQRAVAAARAKAEVLARAAGVTVGAVQSVTENPQDGSGPFPNTFATRFAPAASTPIEVGTTQITADVRVVFALG